MSRAFELLLEDVHRRLFLESMPRIENCLNRLSEEQIWWRPNANSNSIGNLILHLEGNIRQYVLGGLFGQPDNRKRQAEFDRSEGVSKEELLQHISSVMNEIQELLPSLSEESVLTERNVQGFSENGIAILIHVTEHFSYHVGQIAYITKLLTAEDLAFYGDLDLDVTGSD